MNCRSISLLLLLVYALTLGPLSYPSLRAQTSLEPTEAPPVTKDADAAPADTKVPTKVDVQPVARDEEIRARLERILEATGWFQKSSVRVEEGVVFLSGKAETEQRKTWATNLAHNTQDVVAVVNQMGVDEPYVWDLGPARAGLRDLGRDTISSLPFVLFGLIIIPLAWVIAILVVRSLRYWLRRRVTTVLLREVIARAAGLLVFVLGLYIILRVAGLTRLALTVIGGTGLIGLVIGIAFRDITENFLASIFLSMQRPFEVGDLVDIAGTLGYVQRLNVRTTVLMTLTGNHVQLPNAMVYKSTIRNYTSNRNRREDFTCEVAYHVPIAEAQEIALKVLAEHPAVLKDPEPWVLVDSLGSMNVVLRIYFWLNGDEHSWLKVRSSVMRLVKRALQEQEISIPDGFQRVIFPDGVPIHSLEPVNIEGAKVPPSAAAVSKEKDVEPSITSTEAEGGLSSEAGLIKKQAAQARPSADEENLLEPKPADE